MNGAASRNWCASSAHLDEHNVSYYSNSELPCSGISRSFQAYTSAFGTQSVGARGSKGYLAGPRARESSTRRPST
jgi:hypothetical protein